MHKLFILPVLISAVALFAVYLWGGTPALVLAAALAVLEITLSFDNAVLNAKVLERMPRHWQHRFLTWGMLFSVLGVRLLLPILIVSAVTLISPIIITLLAFTAPAQYAAFVLQAQPVIEAFGGMFLLLVALRFFFNEEKSVHWLHPLERRFAKWGEIAAIEVVIALLVLLGIAAVAHEPALEVLKSGVVGVVLFFAVEWLVRVLGTETELNVLRAGAALFVYLNVLDTAFSLDGVVGAFALTVFVPVIVVGLGIGAYFVRTLTLALVRGETLRGLLYLEHGAHWAIFALALCMLFSLVIPIPEWFIASIGLLFIFFSYLSSRRSRA